MFGAGKLSKVERGGVCGQENWIFAQEGGCAPAASVLVLQSGGEEGRCFGVVFYSGDQQRIM
jgi:hypothetical protein